MTLILSGTDGLSDIDGSAATPAIRGTDTNTGIFFPAADTIAFSEGGVEAMRLTSAGSLQIGSTSGSAPRLLVYTSDNTDPAILARQDGTAPIQIWQAPGTERARITSSGDLLVGITSTGSTPTYGAAYIAGDRAVGSGNYYAQVFVPHNSTNNHGIVVKELAASGIAIAFLNSSNSAVGSITTTNTATAYNTSSDYRLKEQVQPMTGALARVTALKPVTYKWKADGSDGEGFIAHELAEVCPQAVTGEKDAVDAEGNPQYQGIDTSFLVATLTAAIQEQQAIIQSLTARIEALEGK